MNQRCNSVGTFGHIAMGAALVASTCVAFAAGVRASAPPVHPDGTTATATFTNSTSQTINIATPSTITSTITVSGLSGVLSDVDVVSAIPHTFPADTDTEDLHGV